MNWTGGRLRRQSCNRPDSISKIQKKHFARARLNQREARHKTHVNAIEKPAFSFCQRDSETPLRLFADNGHRSLETSPLIENQNGVSGLGDQIEAGSKLSKTDSRITYVDNLKKFLLEKKDWVGLSPTRPLQMRFPSIEEKEQIGKRRKIAGHDEARFAANTKRTMVTPRHSSRVYSPQLGQHRGPEMKIYIGSPKTMGRTQRQVFSPLRSSSSSSDTMLSQFDEDFESGEFQPSNQSGVHMLADTNVELDSNNVQSVKQLANTFKHHTGDTQPRSTADPQISGADVTSPARPVLHRFTLDDQVLEEQMANSQAVGAKDLPLHRGFTTPNKNESKHGIMSGGSLSSPEMIFDVTESNLGDKYDSCASGSDTLPQTQKIQRHLPSLPISWSKESNVDAQFVTPKTAKMSSKRPAGRQMSTLFGQQLSLSPEQSHKEGETVGARQNYTSNIHGYPVTSLHNSAKSNVPMDVPETIPNTPREGPGFRFPALWTPHRAIFQIASGPGSALRNHDPSSLVATSDKPLFQFAGSLKQGTLNGNLQSAARIIASHAPVFSTPFRR